MYLQTVKSKNAVSFYAARTVYENGKKTSKIVEKLGTEAELSKRVPDVKAYLKQRIAELTEKEEQQTREVIVKFAQNESIEANAQKSFNGGYLFLQSLYYEMGLDRICKQISKKYEFDYDLNSVLSRLIYGRILFPGSKLSTMKEASHLLEPPAFELHHIYRALEVLAKENDFIQAELYRNSLEVMGRNTNILYYDCTNFFFEIEEEDGLRQYGISKEHRPNPIVELGMFMDGDGIPLAFCIHPGNTNEQLTLKPLEKKILRDFGSRSFVICTDAGLSSAANRKFNSIQNRSFITVQSLKKMKAYQQEWALSDTGWRLCGDSRIYDRKDILKDPDTYRDRVFYKEEWFLEDGLEQRFIVTFSIQYMEYLQQLRERQIQRAQKAIDTGAIGKKRANDPNRFVGQFYFTEDGQIAEHREFSLDQDKIKNEAVYDGFYCVATNLDDPVDLILKTNRRRWEIEESFRLLKSEFKARPVYLSRDDRILAHFITCFLSLVLFRILESKLGDAFTASQITQTLRGMNLYNIEGEGYIPTYTRDSLTDALHQAFGFRTDYRINSLSSMKKVFKATKSSKH
ncbi:MAG: IS1634 family transposase [Eubacterium sp.]|nr:IS1634 family transposase [Eubacterium sp.]